MKRISLILLLLLAILSGGSEAPGAFVPDGFRPPIAVTESPSLVVQPWDGKIVSGGFTRLYPSLTARNLMRLNPDGTLDPTFSTSVNGEVLKIVLLPDHGMIILGGFSTVSYLDAGGVARNVTRRGIARLDANGRPDAFDPCAGVFSGGGFYSGVLLPDGKSLLVGGTFSNVGGTPVKSLVKISLDPATYGALDLSYPTLDSVPFTMAVQDDHRILLAGFFTTVTRGGITTPRPYLIRLNEDGTLDDSFRPLPDQEVMSLVLQPDGKIVIGGYFQSITPQGGSAVTRHSLARLTRFGEVDSFNPDADAEVWSLALQPDGQILAGGTFQKVGGVPRSNVARLNPDGTPDSFNPGSSYEIDAIAVQQDGKILLGIRAGSPISTRPIPRYYPDGTPDDDVAPTAVLPDGVTTPIALQPDGMMTVGGLFTTVGGIADRSKPVVTYTGGTPRKGVVRLKRNWSLADPAQFDPTLTAGYAIESFALQPDWRVWMAGFFPWIDVNSGSPAHRPNLERITPAGLYDPAPDPSGKTFFQNVQSLMVNRTGFVYSQALPPEGSPYQGMAYVGGVFTGDYGHFAMSRYHLFRMTATGERDPSFDPGELMQGRFGIYSGTVFPDPYTAGWGSGGDTGRVGALAIQPDGKLLVAISGPTTPDSIYINRGVLVRLLTDGSQDPTFTPFYVNQYITTLALQRDGQILVGGWFTYPVQHGGTTYQQNMVRLNNGREGYADGTLDDSFVLETSFWEYDWCHDEHGNVISPCLYTSYVNGIALQGNGSMVISGLFNSTKDRLGTVPLDSVARVGADGTVDRSFNLGPIDSFRPLAKVNTAVLQPDGKVVIAGEFQTLNGATDLRHNLARFANPTASLQSLDISPDGSRVSWLRDGSAPELTRVTFEDSADGVNWTLMGSGSAIPGGWGIAVQNPVRRENRYLRGRGYAVTSSRDSVLVEEKRLYYLKPVLTVRPKGLTKSYGAANPALQAEYLGFDAGDTPANSLTGAPVLTTGVTATSGVGDHPIGAALGTLASAKYTFVVADGVFTVTRAPLTVTAGGGTRAYGDLDPAVSFSSSGLLNGDAIASVSFTTSATRLSPVGSAQTITPAAALFSSGSPSNYDITYLPGALTITRRDLTVRADNQYKSAGNPNPPLTVSYLGFAPGEGEGVLSGAPALSTSAGALSPAGNYPITVTVGSLSSPNYNFSFVDGTLFVADQMAQTIDFPMRPHAYGDGDFLPGATATSGLTVSYASGNSALAEIVTDSLGRQRIRVKSPGTSAAATEIAAAQPGSWQYFPAPGVSKTLTVNPPPWHGLSFDGVDDVMRAAHALQLNFPPSGSFTVEGWLHLSGSQVDGTGILSKGGGGGAGYALLLYQDKVAAHLSDGVLSLGPEEGLVGTSSLNDGLWHQVALAVDRQGGVARLYLDGRLEKELALPAGLGTLENSVPLFAGVDGSGSLHFKGELDELRIWNTARSRAEIRSAGSQIIDPANESALVAYYHFDEGTAQGGNTGVVMAPERTASGNDGTLVGLSLSGESSNWVSSGAFAPLLETATVSAVTPGGATGGGILYPNYYDSTERGLCWGSDPNPGIDDSCASAPAGGIPLPGGGSTFSVVITNLTPGASYHVRAYARNVQGLSYGNDLSFQAGKQDQTTTFGTLPTKTYGDPDFPPGGTSGSGLPLTYTSSDPTVAVVTGDEIHITGAGTTTITASQGGDGSYKEAPDVPQLFTVLPAPLIVRADDKSRPYKTQDPPFTVKYSGYVNGEGDYVLQGAPVLSTSALWGSDAGSYPITVSTESLYARNYRFVPTAGTLSITRSGQCITFPLIGERTFGDPPFTVGAAACSGLSVTFVSSDPSIIRVDGNILTVVGAGTVTITAREAGNGNFYDANQISQAVVVHRAGQQVEFSSLAQKVVGDPPFQLAAEASSGLPVSYESSDPAVAQISASTVYITGPGTTVITARQTGGVNFNAATPVTQTLTVAQEGTPPLVLLSTLSSGSSTANPVLNIEGACSDASGIATVTLNGTALSGDLSLFSVALPLASGTNTVTLSALDLSGNRTTETRTVLLQGSAPLLSVSSPPDNSVVGEAQTVVQGSAEGGSAVAVSVNGSALQGLALVNGAFSATAILTQGVNTIEVSAESGGVKTALKRSVALAAGKPAVAIADPVQDAITEGGRMLLRGTAAGAVQVTVQVNGATYHPLLTAGAFEQEVTLEAPGTYRITATATAADGASSVAYRNIIRSSIIRGDLNGDGVVELRDVMQVLSLSLGMEGITPAALAHADVAPLVDGVPHPDGVVDVGDVLVLLRKLVGLVEF